MGHRFIIVTRGFQWFNLRAFFFFRRKYLSLQFIEISLLAPPHLRKPALLVVLAHLGGHSGLHERKGCPQATTGQGNPSQQIERSPAREVAARKALANVELMGVPIVPGLLGNPEKPIDLAGFDSFGGCHFSSSIDKINAAL